MNKIGYELYCNKCGYDWRLENVNPQNRICPNCHEQDEVYINKFITCECGTTVYLDSTENICEGCEERYDEFGRKINN